MSAPCIEDVPKKKGARAALKRIIEVITPPILFITLATFLAGSAFMWYGSIVSLLVTGGFAGIICWQGQGIFYLFYANYLTKNRLKMRNAAGEYEVQKSARTRLVILRWIVTASIMANMFCIGLMAWNWVHGRLKWTRWDTISYGITGVIVGLILLVGLIKKKNMLLKSPWAVFFLVVAIRIIPQSFLSVSNSLANISWWVLGGLLLIAFQRFVISFLEFVVALVNRLSEDNRDKAWLMGLSDAFNLIAAFVPAIAKEIRF